MIRDRRKGENGEETPADVGTLGIVKPATALVPLRAAATAPFTANNRRDASSLTAHGAASSFAKPRREVLLPSEQKPKGVLQYAL